MAKSHKNNTATIVRILQFKNFTIKIVRIVQLKLHVYK